MRSLPSMDLVNSKTSSFKFQVVDFGSHVLCMTCDQPSLPVGKRLCWVNPYKPVWA